MALTPVTGSTSFPRLAEDLEVAEYNLTWRHVHGFACQS